MAREAFGVREALPAFVLSGEQPDRNRKAVELPAFVLATELLGRKRKAVRTDRTPNAARSSEILFLNLYNIQLSTQIGEHLMPKIFCCSMSTAVKFPMDR